MVGIAGLLAAVVLLMVGKRAIAFGVTALIAPWLLAAVLVAGSVTGSSVSGTTFSAVATAAPTPLAVTPGLATLALWLTARRPSPPSTVVD